MYETTNIKFIAFKSNLFLILPCAAVCQIFHYFQLFSFLHFTYPQNITRFFKHLWRHCHQTWVHSSGVPRIFFVGGCNKFSWGQRAERTGSGGGSHQSDVSLCLQISETRIVIGLLRMYFPTNWDFSSTLSKLRNFVGVPPKLPRYTITTLFVQTSTSCHVILVCNFTLLSLWLPSSYWVFTLNLTCSISRNCSQNAAREIFGLTQH
jgi:hypothetical protein